MGKHAGEKELMDDLPFCSLFLRKWISGEGEGDSSEFLPENSWKAKENKKE